MSPKVRSAFFCGVLAAALAAVPLSAVAEEVNAMGAQQTEVVASDTFTRAGDAPQAAVAERPRKRWNKAPRPRIQLPTRTRRPL